MSDFDATKAIKLIDEMQEYLKETSIQLENYKQIINSEILRVD